MTDRVAIFDLDGTLVDSDAALMGAFVRCGVAEQDVTFGHVLADECHRLGIAVADFLAAYDPAEARPFPGVHELLSDLPVWALASHKDRSSGLAELEGFGWFPAVACFAQDFGGPKRLDLVLDRLGLGARDVLFVGDTSHDRSAAVRAGVDYVVAGWNRRADIAPGDRVAEHPSVIADLLRG